MNLKRVELGTVLPLDTPFSVYIYPIYSCNFKCGYCIRSLSSDELTKKGLNNKIMTLETFKQVTENLKLFPRRIKSIQFSGYGEPLLHPQIAEMVKILKKANVAERVEIITNASVLTHELSDALIDAGLDRLRVSIQGLNCEKYKEIAKVDIKIDDIVEKLEYFCVNKKHTDVYVKTVDVALDTPSDEQLFHEMFKNACDESRIEYVHPSHKNVDYSKYELNGDMNQHGNYRKPTRICPMPFYLMCISPDGDVLPCCSSTIPLSYGNIKEKSLKELWNSSVRNKFLIQILSDMNKISTCSECCIYSNMQDGDYLDEYKDELIKKFSERI